MMSGVHEKKTCVAKNGGCGKECRNEMKDQRRNITLGMNDENINLGCV